MTNNVVLRTGARGIRKWWALAALTLAVLAVGLDSTVVSVALPTLANALHASASELQWFAAAFSLVLAAGLLLGGLLGDRYGRKKMLLVALFIFGGGSIASAYAPSPAALIAAQALLGLGAAFIVPLSLSVLTVLYTDQERPRAVGIWAAANFLALPVGPILGGWLLTNYWWGWVFLINVPVILLAAIAVAVLLPESRSEKRPQIDLPGIAAASAGLVGLVYGLIQAGRDGWGNIGDLAFVIAGLLVLFGFALWQRWLSRRPRSEPLVDPALFRNAGFTWGTILATTAIFAMFGVLFSGPQYFQAILGTNAMGSGLRLLPMIGGLVIGAVVADRIATLAGAKITVALGFALLAAGLGLGATTSPSSGEAFNAIWTAVVGLGMGFGLATASSAALTVLSPEQSGVGSAVMQMVQKAGGPLGIAILGSILSSVYRGHLNVAQLPSAAANAAQTSVFAGLAVAQKIGSASLANSARASYVQGMDAMLWVCGGVAVLSIVLALIFMPMRSHAIEKQVAKR